VKDVADGGHMRLLFASLTGDPTIAGRFRRVLRDGSAQFAPEGPASAASLPPERPGPALARRASTPWHGSSRVRLTPGTITPPLHEGRSTSQRCFELWRPMHRKR